MTNEIIVGEVEFYLVAKDKSLNLNNNLQDNIQNNNIMNSNISKGNEYQLTANFIGTDFNYATSNQFRQIFLD